MTAATGPHDYPGKLIVLEGIDGAGKSTLARRICDLCDEAVFTKEPWRDIDLDMPNGDVLLPELFWLDRLLHVEKVIRPELEKGRTVVCDRYHWSQCAYQGTEYDVDIWDDPDLIEPDLIIYVDIPATVSVSRIASRDGREVPRSELEALRRIRGRYLSIRGMTRVNNFILAYPRQLRDWEIRKMVR